MRLPEKCFEWQAGAWKFGVTLCPYTSAHRPRSAASAGDIATTGSPRSGSYIRISGHQWRKISSTSLR